MIGVSKRVTKSEPEARQEGDRDRICPRVLLLSGVCPDTNGGGGRLAIYRHFVARHDCDVAVASRAPIAHADVAAHRIQHGKVTARLRKTRLARGVTHLDYVRNWFYLPRSLVEFARAFDPDVIFSVVDDWHMGQAWQLSRRLRVPLAVDFQDLFALSRFLPWHEVPAPPMRRFLLRRYQFLVDHSEEVFHTSEGMRRWFGRNARGHVLYPIGDSGAGANRRSQEAPSETIRLLYAGNCYGAYGRMLLRLAEASLREPRLRLRIFTGATDWPEAKVEEMRQAGIFRGFAPFDELKEHLADADAFLTVMSFEPEERPFVSTSFTTKWLDYVPYERPVFVWGPEYCTAATFAREHGAGHVVDQDAEEVLVSEVLAALNDRRRWESLSLGARAAHQRLLSPGAIHELLMSRLRALAEDRRSAGRNGVR